MHHRTVLISGGGIAGTTLAHGLARRGFAPTVVERAAGARSSGSPVDVRGPAVEVAEDMGVMRQLRDAATRVERLTFVDGGGRPRGGLPLGAFAHDADRAVELPRADLAAILYGAVRDDVEYVADDSISTLEQDPHGVDVTFERGAPRRFDLVVGADGLHSNVRRLVFGPERRYVRHLGMYVATLPLGRPAESPYEVLTYNSPNKAVSLHPGRGSALVAFMVRRREVTGFDYRDVAQHRRLLREAFAGEAWRTPEFLQRLEEVPDPDLYFDAVSRVRLDRWSQGRVALLGDAASCVSLFGDGSSLAMAGAATLAAELAASSGDHRAALSRYEAAHRRLATPKQRQMTAASRLLVPATRAGIGARNAATRVWAAAAGVRGGARRSAAVGGG
ncbi:FAD-dependent monooxygenase [Streptomyces sp. ODS28]|uniref:FAD-dependent monooxygenase n=1 Tax=Streptomyces sp. ODS28 TaxID=3136688 RepID=UPI0031E81B33